MNRSLACACAGVSLVGVAWLTKPRPYPPLGSTAAGFPPHVAAGLGPFAYYSPEVGATARLGESKPGLNCPGTKFSGLVARSESSYDSWPEKTFVAPTGIFHIRRNLAKYQFNSVSSFAERRAIEKEIVAVLNTAGTYYGLPGSQSAEQCLSESQMDTLRRKGSVFEAPWTAYDLSMDCGRFWPDARGVWLDASSDTVVWVNHEDHLEIVGCDLERIELILEFFEKKFKKDQKHGFLTVRPENVS